MLRDIVFCLLPDRPALPPALRREATLRALSFVEAALDAAPVHIWAAEKLLRVVLWLWLLGAGQRLADMQPPDAAVERRVERFASLTPQTAAIVRLYRSLAVLAFYETPGVAALISGTHNAERQSRFRALRAGLAVDRGN